MNGLLEKLHARMGDLWWYSAMIFVACRSGDVINAFIGLWLVPKYVGPNELGAVLPLQQLTSFLTVPLGVVAIVFAKYVNTYATRGEYGKVKGFIRDVFTASMVLFVICIAGAYLVMPFFYDRLRIESGSLTILILASGLVSNINTIVNSAQQGLKRFKTMSIMTFLGAPVRLITMLVAMPFRALSGYMLGQTTPGILTTTLSIFDIRSALRSCSADSSWRKDIPEICRYMWPIVIYMALGTLFSSISATVYRQRLPEIESSAYYMLTRFADIVSFVGCAISAVLVPLASEAHEKGKENLGMLRQTVIGSLAATVGLAVFFALIGKFVLSLNDTWKIYEPYSYLLPYLTLLSGICMTNTALITYDIACRRFKSMTFVTVTNLLWTIALVVFTGCEFFRGHLPDFCVDAMASLHLATLHNLTFTYIGVAGLQTIVLILFAIIHAKRLKAYSE